MKQNIFLILGAAILFPVFISSVLYSEGSPGAKTGSPLDAATCAQCHISNVQESSWITTNIPDLGWIPGETYTITLRAEPETASYIGFEITAENENSKTGTFLLTDEERTRFTNKDKAVTHSHSGTEMTDGKSIWEINWQAPNEDVGNVSFYAAFNAANGDASTEGDQIYASNISYDQAQPTAISQKNQLLLKIFPNPASTYLFIQSPARMLSVLLYDLNGRQVKSFRAINDNRTQLDIREVQKGNYIVNINTVNGDVHRQIQFN
ncbi:MAG: choice-of-anchor V domain-containing protein [Prolixibacteraceae bacterium]